MDELSRRTFQVFLPRFSSFPTARSFDGFCYGMFLRQTYRRSVHQTVQQFRQKMQECIDRMKQTCCRPSAIKFDREFPEAALKMENLELGLRMQDRMSVLMRDWKREPRKPQVTDITDIKLPEEPATSSAKSPAVKPAGAVSNSELSEETEVFRLMDQTINDVENWCYEMAGRKHSDKKFKEIRNRVKVVIRTYRQYLTERNMSAERDGRIADLQRRLKAVKRKLT